MKISFLSLDFFSLTLKIFLALLGGAIAPSPLSTPAWKLNRPAVAGARVTHVKATFRENSNKLACSDLPAVDILNHIRKGSSDAASDYQHSSNLFCMIFSVIQSWSFFLSYRMVKSGPSATDKKASKLLRVISRSPSRIPTSKTRSPHDSARSLYLLTYLLILTYSTVYFCVFVTKDPVAL